MTYLFKCRLKIRGTSDSECIAVDQMPAATRKEARAAMIEKHWDDRLDIAGAKPAVAIVGKKRNPAAQT